MFMAGMPPLNCAFSGTPLMPYFAFCASPKGSCSELEEMRFHDARNSLNMALPITRDHPPTSDWPRFRMWLAKSPEAMGSTRAGGSSRRVSMKL